MKYILLIHEDSGTENLYFCQSGRTVFLSACDEEIYMSGYQTPEEAADETVNHYDSKAHIYEYASLEAVLEAEDISYGMREIVHRMLV